MRPSLASSAPMSSEPFFAQKWSQDQIKAILDRKRLRGIAPSGLLGSAAYLAGTFVLGLGILVPAYFAVILPIVGIYSAVVLLPRRLHRTAAVNNTTPLAISEVREKPVLLNDREFDVVVYGVTGLCGAVVAEYLLQMYGSKISMAYAGRSESKLQAARASLAALTKVPGADAIPLIIADSSDEQSLIAMCKRTRVVATTVGPYAKYGEPLVRACALTGTGYTDLTGEADWAADMKSKYNDVATHTGARILHMCGVDSVPSEIGTQFVVDLFKKRFGKAPTHVDNVLYAVGGGLPGGTVDTVITVIDNGGPQSAPARKDSVSGKARTTVSATTPAYIEGANSWTMPWMMGPVNSTIVKRSNAAVGFAPNLVYTEGMKVPSFWFITACVMPMLTGITLFVLPPVRELLFSLNILPRPGQGPSRETMARGVVDFTLYAHDGSGNQVAARFGGLGDPGCILTAVFMGETSVALATEHEKLKAVGAGLLPGSAIGHEMLIPRLIGSGRVVVEEQN